MSDSSPGSPELFNVCAEWQAYAHMLQVSRGKRLLHSKRVDKKRLAAQVFRLVDWRDPTGAVENAEGEFAGGWSGGPVTDGQGGVSCSGLADGDSVGTERVSRARVQVQVAMGLAPYLVGCATGGRLGCFSCDSGWRWLCGHTNMSP